MEFFMKKYLLIISCIVITTIVLIVTNNILYGTETIYIVDYMPPVEPGTPPWHITKLIRTIYDMETAFFIGIILSTIESIILYKMQLLKKDIVSLILALSIYIIPILIACIKLSNIYGFTM